MLYAICMQLHCNYNRNYIYIFICIYIIKIRYVLPTALRWLTTSSPLETLAACATKFERQLHAVLTLVKHLSKVIKGLKTFENYINFHKFKSISKLMQWQWQNCWDTCIIISYLLIFLSPASPIHGSYVAGFEITFRKYA